MSGPKSTTANICIPGSASLASVVAFMVALQSPTLASTHQRSNSYRPDTSWLDYSSDNYHHQLNPFENQHSSSSPQLYYSEDEREERIVSALAKADSLSCDDGGDFDTAFSTSEESSSSPRQRRRRRRRKKSKRRKRNRKQQVKQQSIDSSLAVSGEGEGTDQLSSITERRNGAYETSDDKRNSISSSNSSKEPLETEDDTSLKEETIRRAQTERPNLNSRLEDLEAKLQSRKTEVRAYDTSWSRNDSNTQQWGIRNKVPEKSDVAFVRPRQSQQPSDPSSEFARPPAPPPIPPQAISKVGSRPPGSKLRSDQRYPRVPTNGQGGPVRTKPKAANPTTLSASKRSTTLSSTKDNSVSSWVRKFHSSRPKDCLVVVPREYLLDNFNLARLAPVVEHLAALKQKDLETSNSPNLEHNGKSSSMRMRRQQQQQRNNNQLPPQKYAYPIYRQALELILKQPVDTTTTKVEEEREPSQVVQYAAEVLYTLVHARFVVSPRGLDSIRSRLIVHGSKSINQPLFGRCQRLDCGGMPLLPCGLSDDFDDSDIVDHQHNILNSKAKRYCCFCGETFHCWDSKVDGSAWGTSVSHLLLMVYGKSDLFPSHFATPYNKMTTPSSESTRGIKSTIAHHDLPVASPGRIFGFPIHPSSNMS